MKTTIMTIIALALYLCSLWLISISDAELREYKVKMEQRTYQILEVLND